MLKDYIRYRLTGVMCSDFGDASGSLMLDVVRREWSDETARTLGLSPSIFPELRGSDSAGGTLTREASRLTGLREGLPVVVGTGDGICTILGLGVIDSGDVGITVGSAGVIGVATAKPPVDEQHRNYVFCHPARDRWYSIMATAASGDTLRWYRDEVLRDSDIAYTELDREAREIEPGADGLLFLPYILGSRNPNSNPDAVGMFLGLRRKHGRKHMTRAVMEGILLEILDLYMTEAEVAEKLGIGLQSVKVSGGIVKSELWLHMLADVLGKKIVLTEQEELGTLGCAILAYTGIGTYRSLRDAVKGMVREKREIEFDGTAHATYRKKFTAFRRAYRQMETLALPPDN
jgi:xylulokinase